MRLAAPFGTLRLPDDGGDIYAVLASGAAVVLKTKDGGVPFMGLQHETQSIDTIVHEHYDGPSVARARNLKRMYFGKNIGRYRWEYWVPNGTPRRRLVCPPLAYSAPPAPGWVMSDYRMWTNLVPNTTNFSLANYGWVTLESRRSSRCAPCSQRACRCAGSIRTNCVSFAQIRWGHVARR